MRRKASMFGKMIAGLAVVALMASVAQATLVWDTPLSLPSTDATTWNVNTTVAAFDVVAQSGVGAVGTVSWGGETWTRLGNTDPSNGGSSATVGGITYTDFNYHGDGSTGRYSGIPVLDDLAGGVDGDVNSSYVTLSGFDSSKTYLVQYFTAANLNGWQAQVFGFDGVGNSGYATIGANYAVFSGTLTGATSLKVNPRLSAGGTDDSNFDMSYYSGVRIALIPEPGSGLLLIAGAAGLGLLRRKIRG